MEPRMRLLLLLCGIATVSQAETDCYQGACYPSSGNLLIGRENQLQASSTCGLTGSEIYCTPYQQRRMKCCPCDSRDPRASLAHTAQDMLSSAGPNRWWQSKKDETPVSLELDLKHLFRLDNLYLKFKGPRPNAMVLERTQDGGRTWHASLFLAADCQRSFPGVPTTLPLTLDSTYCQTLPPTGQDPYQDQSIEFSPLRQYAYVPLPDSKKREDVSSLTSLRLRMTELGDVPHLPGQSLSKFYAVREMRVTGSCMCHGHANRCLPEDEGYPQTYGQQVGPRCECQHHTAGMNCERCDDLYNDQPWRPAVEQNTHSCKRCECNNHAERCHFDPVLYEASGRRSGGVCEGCLHHTTGPKCDQCAPGYQPNPYSQMDRPDACIRCVCNADGTINGGRCDDVTGSCQCKANVVGQRCDQCKRGYHGLSASNPLGCSKCICSSDGSLSDECNPLTGQCPCRHHFHGLTCDKCARGYWKSSISGHCQPCSCDPTKSFSDTCDQNTGQCECRPGFGGRTCSGCADNTYGDPLMGCKSCRCNSEGTLPDVCDKQTGECLCRPGVTGSRCDSCKEGHCDSFPSCQSCPSCYFTLDAERKKLSAALEKLSPRYPTRPGGSGEPGNFGPRILALENDLNRIRDSIDLPPNIAKEVDDALSQLKKLRDEVDRVNNELPRLTKKPDPESELDKLQNLLNSLNILYNAKRNFGNNTIDPNTAGAISAIKDAYDRSTDAQNNANDSQDTVQESADTRKDALDLVNEVQPDNTRDLNKLNGSMASKPNLTPVAKQVCGSVRTEPCTPLQCKGRDLCPPEGTPLCQKGQTCVGALPLSKRANEDAKETKDRVDELSNKITEAAEKLQETQDKTNLVRKSAEKLAKKVKEAKDELEEDVKDTRDALKDVKDFLSDPTSNLTHIQDVSDLVLNTKLPQSLASLKRKLEELKDVANNLPDSTAVLKEAKPQLEEAKKLLKEAEEIRDKVDAVKADVDGLVNNFDTQNKSLSDLEDKLEKTMGIIDNLTNNLNDIEDQLTPAEKTLDDVSKLADPMKPQLDELNDLLDQGRDQAENAKDKADDAKKEEEALKQDLDLLDKELENLPETPPTGKTPVAEGSLGDRINKLQEDAGVLANNTENMLGSLEGKADTLRDLQDEILQKSEDLENVKKRLKEILESLRKSANDLSICQA